MARLTMVHWRRTEGRKGGRRRTEGEGVACEVSRSPEQGRRAQGKRRAAAADRMRARVAESCGCAVVGSDLGLGMGRGDHRLYMDLLRAGVGWAGQWPKEPLGQWGRVGHRAAHLAVSCPSRVMGQAGGPCTALVFVPCRHGHAARRAVPWAVPPAHGRLEIYTPGARGTHEILFFSN
jgi:hypothetical protein